MREGLKNLARRLSISNLNSSQEFHLRWQVQQLHHRPLHYALLVKKRVNSKNLHQIKFLRDSIRILPRLAQSDHLRTNALFSQKFIQKGHLLHLHQPIHCLLGRFLQIHRYFLICMIRGLNIILKKIKRRKLSLSQKDAHLSLKF